MKGRESLFWMVRISKVGLTDKYSPASAGQTQSSRSEEMQEVDVWTPRIRHLSPREAGVYRSITGLSQLEVT